MDETATSTVPKEAPKEICSKAKRSVNNIVSKERGRTITIACYMGASENVGPPILVFPRYRMKQRLLDSAPPSSIAMVSDSGFINC
jgi:hypothetical protein